MLLPSSNREMRKMGFLKERIFTWGYVLDKVPTAAPFTFGKTRCSLETQSAYLGADKTFYMNTMFNEEYIQNAFSDPWDPEIIENCVKNRLSPAHMERISTMKEVFCTAEHLNYMESALNIARASLVYKNIKGVHFDDFSPTQGGEMLAEIHDRVKEINPDLQIAVVTYTHQDEKVFGTAVKYADVFSRWRWVPSLDYWDHYADDIAKLRDIVGEDKKIIQGIYIHDFGSGNLPVTRCRHCVPLDIFKKSVETICEHVWEGTIDGIIIPQAAWFSFPSHREHVTWLKEYIDWFDATTTVIQ